MVTEGRDWFPFEDKAVEALSFPDHSSQFSKEVLNAWNFSFTTDINKDVNVSSD